MNLNLNNIIGIAQKLKSNPLQALLEAKLNVPQDIGSDPQQIVQHLLNTGQISQEQVNNAMQMSKNPMFQGVFK